MDIPHSQNQPPPSHPLPYKRKSEAVTSSQPRIRPPAGAAFAALREIAGIADRDQAGPAIFGVGSPPAEGGETEAQVIMPFRPPTSRLSASLQPRIRPPKPAPPVLRNDRQGAQVRRAEASAATAGRSPDDETAYLRVVLAMLDEPDISPQVALLWEILPSANAVGEVLHLCSPMPNIRMRSPFSQHMTNDPALQRVEREQARAELAQRALRPLLALADAEIRVYLMQRILVLTQGINPMAALPVHELRDWPDDLVLAATGVSATDLNACIRRLGVAGMAEALGMPSAYSVSSVLLYNGAWRRNQTSRIEALRTAQAAGNVARPARVNELRQRLARLVVRSTTEQAMPNAINAVIQARRGEGSPAAPGLSGEAAPPDIKPTPDVLFEAQHLDPAILACDIDGGDWLARLNFEDARILDRSWHGFERHELTPSGLPESQWPGLRSAIQARLRDLIRPSAQALAEALWRYPRVTDLEDSENRGMGVRTRQPLQAFEPLFFYGGTVCVADESTRRWHDRHPDAWRYALDVSLQPEDTPGAVPPDATCFGYPRGSLGTLLNTRRLNGSDLARRAAASVTQLIVTVPGLPFGLPLLVTRQAVAADEELFLDYGGKFSGHVSKSLAPLPRWPVVKLEPRTHEPASLADFLVRYRAAPTPLRTGLQPGPAAPSSPASDDTVDRLPDRVFSRLAASGWRFREVPEGGDDYLEALDGHRLAAASLQQLRHDLADLIARWPDTPDDLRHNGRAVVQALRGVDGLPAGAAGREVSNGLYADLVRVPGQGGGLTELRAWCQLEDERRWSRAGPRRRQPLKPTRVALLSHEGRLWMISAEITREIRLSGLDEAAQDARLGRELRRADVALWRQGRRFGEILGPGDTVPTPGDGSGPTTDGLPDEDGSQGSSQGKSLMSGKVPAS